MKPMEGTSNIEIIFIEEKRQCSNPRSGSGRTESSYEDKYHFLCLIPEKVLESYDIIEEPTARTRGPESHNKLV